MESVKTLVCYRVILELLWTYSFQLTEILSTQQAQIKLSAYGILELEHASRDLKVMLELDHTLLLHPFAISNF